MASFDTVCVNDALSGTLFYGKLHHFATIDSTNTRALADAQKGAEPGQVYIADEQTAGRGRGGHTWLSEPDRGLYLTVLVRPRLHSNDVLKLSLITGIAAVQAIDVETGIPMDIRWPNDLVTARKGARSLKFGGILTEAASRPDGTLRHAAIGIGINLNQTVFPPELASVATSLKLETNSPVSRERLAIELLQQLDRELTLLETHDAEYVIQRFENYSTWVRGKRVHVAEDEGYTGTTAGLTADGLLRVACGDGTFRTVRHGGVREL